MMTLQDRLISRRNALGLTQEELAKKAGITRVGISKIELGLTKNARADTLLAIANVLKCNPEWLLYGEESKTENNSFVIVPEITWTQASEWSGTHATDSLLHACPVPASRKTFAAKISRDSMMPRFEPQDLVFIDPANTSPSSNSFIAVRTNSGDADLRQYQDIGGIGYLKMLNTDYPPEVRISKIEDKSCIIGLVIAHLKPV